MMPQAHTNIQAITFSGILIVILQFGLTSIAPIRETLFPTVFPSVLVELTNNQRSQNQLNTLKISPLLQMAAQMKADDMAKKGYFSHNTPEGKTPWYWIKKAGYRYLSAGENLAVKFSESENVETAWMESALHRANILSPKYTEIGVATAKGIYKGQETQFVVQMFGKPKE